MASIILVCAAILSLIFFFVCRSKGQKRRVEAEKSRSKKAEQQAQYDAAKQKIRAVDQEKRKNHKVALKRVKELMREYEDNGLSEMEAFQAAVEFVRDSEGLDYIELSRYIRNVSRTQHQLQEEYKGLLGH